MSKAEWFAGRTGPLWRKNLSKCPKRNDLQEGFGFSNDSYAKIPEHQKARENQWNWYLFRGKVEIDIK